MTDTDKPIATAPQPKQIAEASLTLWKKWFGLAATLFIFAIVTEVKLWRPDTLFFGDHNAQIEEAQAWHRGRLDLDHRHWDTAFVEHKIYSHFPPLFSFVSYAALFYFHGFPHPLLTLLIWLPLPLLAYRLFFVLSRDWAISVVLAIGLTCGTSIFPVVDLAVRNASPYFVNQMLSVNGLLIFLIAYFGSRNIWLAGAGLVIMALSRQMTLAFAIPLTWLAFRPLAGHGVSKRIVATFAAIGIVLAVYMILNTLKFGSPLDSGYMYIYADRPADEFSRDAYAYGIFSSHCVPRNAYYLNVGLAKVYHGYGTIRIRPDLRGTGIWWTTPVLLWALVGLRGILRDPARRALLAAVVLVIGGLLLYHSTGYSQRGFNRYSLDFVPALMALATPMAIRGWRLYVSFAMIGWSVAYFCWLI